MADSENYDITKNTTQQGAGGVNALNSFKAIMKVVDRHRPYEPSDFIKEYYIADMALAAPLALGAAIKFAPMIQQFLMNAKCM